MKRLLIIALLLGIGISSYSQNIAVFRSYRAATRGELTGYKWKNVPIKGYVTITFHTNDSKDLLSIVDKIEISNGFEDVFTTPFRAERTDKDGYLYAAYDKDGKDVAIELIVVPVRAMGSTIYQHRIYIRYKNIEYYYIYKP